MTRTELPAASPLRWARILLTLTPVVGLTYVLAVRSSLVRARPEAAYLLAVPPLVALVLALARSARSIVAVALVELALLVPLHGLLTWVRAWRLE